jgi:hypothetical protein
MLLNQALMQGNLVLIRVCLWINALVVRYNEEKQAPSRVLHCLPRSSNEK